MDSSRVELMESSCVGGVELVKKRRVVLAESSRIVLMKSRKVESSWE